MQVPVNLKCSDTVPLIEHYWQLGASDGDIVEKVAKETLTALEKHNYAVLYGHGLLEGSIKAEVLESILLNLKKKGFTSMRLDSIAKKKWDYKLVDLHGLA